ncbi:MAG TPA: DnaJ domain-containing protein [Candidatus Limnocylindria bacterium]|nr:DnaJ domain-containing protein [Candidatus Limnocylindria bacterium]
MSTYYDLLGVARSATELEIRSAYGRDVVQLQNDASDKVGQFRAALDAAFATLVDPLKRSAYDEALVAAAQDGAEASADETAAAFGYAMRGGLWFAGGGIVTAATYAFSQGTYLIAWGPLLFGGFQLVRGLLRYLTVPNGARKPSHMGLLAGLVAVGLLSAGFVIGSEALAAQEMAEGKKWNALIDATTLDVTKASDLVQSVANRPGPWSAGHSADMEKASVLYASVADAVAAGGAPSRLEWYRVAMATNFRDAAAITHEYSLLSATSPSSAFEALDKRWKVRLAEETALADRFEAQEKTAP